MIGIMNYYVYEFIMFLLLCFYINKIRKNA